MDAAVPTQGAPFVVSGGEFIVNPHGSMAVTIEFAPTAKGKMHGVLEITSSDPKHRTVKVKVARGKSRDKSSPLGQGIPPDVSVISRFMLERRGFRSLRSISLSLGARNGTKSQSCNFVPSITTYRGPKVLSPQGGFH